MTPSFAQTAYKFHLNFPVPNFMKISPLVFELFYDGQIYQKNYF